MITKFQMLSAAEQEQAVLHGLAVGAMRLKRRYDYEVPDGVVLRASRIIGKRAKDVLEGTLMARQAENRWAGYARVILANDERQTNRRGSHSQKITNAGYDVADAIVPRS